MAKKQRKTTKVITKRKKFIEVEIPLIRSKIELIGTSPQEINGRTIKLDLTRQLKGKSVEVIVKINIEKEKVIAYPKKIRLMPYFIKRMIRKRISYIEDSFKTPSQESMLIIKPFLITRKKVSRAVRKTLRNRAKNWIEDYIAEKKDNEIFNEILSNRLQKQLSLTLKKTYPLSLCEIRILEIKRNLKPEEIPKIKKQTKKQKEEKEEIIDQMKEIEEEKIKKAEQEIKQTQEKAISREDTSEKPLGVLDKEETKTKEDKEEPKTEKKKISKTKSEEKK